MNITKTFVRFVRRCDSTAVFALVHGDKEPLLFFIISGNMVASLARLDFILGSFFTKLPNRFAEPLSLGGLAKDWEPGSRCRLLDTKKHYRQYWVNTDVGGVFVSNNDDVVQLIVIVCSFVFRDTDVAF